MDALDAALTQHAATAASGVDPLDAALLAHAASKPGDAKPAVSPLARPSPGLGGTFLNGMAKGVAGFGDMIGSTAVNLANLGIAGYGLAAHGITGRADSMPDLIPSDTLSGYSKLGHILGAIDDNKDPTTGPGRFADITGQVMGGGGINPRALASAMLRVDAGPIVRQLVTAGASGVGAGTGSELTGDVNTGSDSADNLIKALATAGGGMAAGGTLALRGRAADRVAAATAGVTPQQWAAAIARSNLAAEQGSPITGYEALQAETGLNPKMQTQQRVAEQSDAANGGLTQMMQNRPDANQALINQATGAISPANPFPDTLAGTLQRAAGGAIQGARDQGNAAAQPFYARSSNDPNVRIPSQDWNALSADPAVAWALEQTKRSPLLGVQDAAEGSVQWLDAAKKFLDSHGQSLAQAGDRFPAGQAGAAAKRITDAIDPLVPDYAKARSIVADNITNNVEPMEAGQVGKLSRSDSFPAQAETLLPNKPTDVTPQVVERTANTINTQDPNIMRQFVAQFLRGQYDEAGQQNIAGPNVFGGSKFAAQVAGNPMQEKNLVAALTSSGAEPQQMLDALQIFRAQGMKPAVNSATTANASEQSALSGGLAGFVKNPIASTLGGPWDWWRNGGAASDLAAALSSGAGSVDDLASLARTNGSYNPTQQQIMANLMMASKVPQTSAYDQYIKAFDAAPDDETKRALGAAYAASQGLPTSPSGP